MSTHTHTHTHTHTPHTAHRVQYGQRWASMNGDCYWSMVLQHSVLFRRFNQAYPEKLNLKPSAPAHQCRQHFVFVCDFFFMYFS
jgi:hypothetical protein